MRQLVPIYAIAVVGLTGLGAVLALRANAAAGDGHGVRVARAHLPTGGAPERISIASGQFYMGSNDGSGAADEQPRHRVTMASFSLDRFEVTNARYRACVAAGACSVPAFSSSQTRRQYFGDPAFADYPVIFVDFAQAEAFCRWNGGRLPSEAEWEYAARGPVPSVRQFPWGDDAPTCDRANLSGCLGDTDRVGNRPLGASPFGALDMAGNVWEWTQDWYDARYYEHSPQTDPAGPAEGTLKVMRGGCWMSGPDSLRVSCRKAELPSTWAPNVGFRCAYSEER